VFALPGGAITRVAPAGKNELVADEVNIFVSLSTANLYLIKDLKPE
jgi:hypothetical protein